MMNSCTSTVDKSTKASTSRLESTPKPTVNTDQSSSSKYFENLQDATGNSAYVPVKRSLKDRMDTLSEEDSKEERPESTPEQESKIQSLQTLVAKQSKEIVEYQEEMTILQLEKEEILEEVCTLKRKIDELQGEDDEVIMSVTKKVTGHTMKISAFWNLMTFQSIQISQEI